MGIGLDDEDCIYENNPAQEDCVNVRAKQFSLRKILTYGPLNVKQILTKLTNF